MSSPGKSHRSQQTVKDASLTVYFDGSCPLCRSEISWFQNRGQVDEVLWIDVAKAHETDLGSDLTQADAMKRFHVRTADGRLHSGSRAFAHMWRTTPGFRSLGKVAGIRWVSVMLEWLYRGFLRIRPALQWIYRRIKPHPPQHT